MVKHAFLSCTYSVFFLRKLLCHQLLLDSSYSNRGLRTNYTDAVSVPIHCTQTVRVLNAHPTRSSYLQPLSLAKPKASSYSQTCEMRARNTKRYRNVVRKNRENVEDTFDCTHESIKMSL